MRENIGIYRGKRIDTGAWKEGYLLGLQDRMIGKNKFIIVDKNGEYHRVDPETVGEYTGYSDKDDSGVFEGDVVQSVESGETGEVQYFPEHTAFMIFVRGSNNYVDYMGEVKPSIVKVIGNIHDNPELMNDLLEDNLGDD